MKQKTITLVFIVLLAAILSLRVAIAGEQSEVPADAFPLVKGDVGQPGTEPGQWLDRYSPFEDWADPNRPKPSAAWQQQLLALAAVVRQSPALSDLRGYYPQVRLRASDDQPVDQGSLHIAIWWPHAVVAEPGIADPAKRYLVKPETMLNGPAGFDIYINRLPESGNGKTDAFTSMNWMQDAQGKFFPLPRAERSIAGFPVYGGFLFVTAPSKTSLFRPVSQERAMHALIAGMQAQVQTQSDTQGMVSEQLAYFNSPEMKKLRQQAIDEAAAREKDPARSAAARAKAERDDQEQERQLREMASRQVSQNPVVRQVNQGIAELQARLAAMNASERQAPAYMLNTPEKNPPMGIDLVSTGEQGAVALMEYNPDFFDSSQPHTMQLVTVPVLSYADLQDRDMTVSQMEVQERVPIAIAEQTDWHKVAALLK
ncbi:MAG TPA: hypothetical protein VNI58_04225 [Mariprofundaceae bacterium]|nr:hypothetical protein [Mariprofundaceae bacterium]